MITEKICEYCKNLEELDFECVDGPHHGAEFLCEECGAEYYEEYCGDIQACNLKAKFNHPELKIN